MLIGSTKHNLYFEKLSLNCRDRVKLCLDGAGLSVFNSSYPEQRVKKDANDLDMGVIGSVSLLQNANLSTQPISSFDWSPDKVSITVMSSSPDPWGGKGKR